MVWNPAAKHMAKIDNLGKQATDRLRASRNTDSSSTVSDRIRAATSGSGQTSAAVRWDREQAARKKAEMQHIEEQGADTGSHTPPVVASERRTAPAAQPFPSRPPPPPQRSGLASPHHPPKRPVSLNSSTARPQLPPRMSVTGSGSATPTVPPRSGPPRLPPRMNNEAGTANPPPPYQPADGNGAPLTQEGSQTERAGPPPPSARRGPPPIPAGRKPDAVSGNPLKFKPKSPSIPLRAAPAPSASSINVDSTPLTASMTSMSVRDCELEPSRVPRQVGGSVSSLGPLTASRQLSDQPCQALSAATFFCYPASFPEWASQPPWFATSGSQASQASPVVPPHLANTEDRAWKAVGEMQTCRRPDGTTSRRETQFGCVLFSDLSSLWYRIAFDSSNPAMTYECNVAYAEPPSPWNNSNLLEASALSYGELVARFCEAREGTSVGNGECWTLAHDALAQINAEQGWPQESHALTSVGRTHGHLIYYASADNCQPPKGLWRGGDVGNVRRGDIVEWDGYAVCKLLNPAGAISTMGNPAKGWPEHTAVVVGVGRSPRPEVVAVSENSETPFSPHELIHLEVLDQSSGVPVARKTLDLRAGKWTRGSVHIYRPVGQETYLEGKVEPRAWPGGSEEATRRKGWEPLN